MLMLTNKAFIFDLDGVIIDSETWWDKLYFQKDGHSLGQTIESAYQEVKKTDPNLSWDKYLSKLKRQAKIIYNQAPLTPGINKLLTKLIKNNYHLGLVSGSTQQWINYVLKRLNYPLDLAISLHNRQDLKSKPAPDGYLEMMEQLGVKPQNTIVLEDSNLGIQSGKAAGAFVICLTEHHPINYHPTGADLYVNSLKELTTKLDSIQL